MALQIDLDSHQQELIDKLVAEGVYKNAAEAIADGLRRIEDEHNARAIKAEALRSAVQAGFDDAEAGNYIDITTSEARAAFWDEMRAELDQRAAQRAAKAV